MSYPKLRVDINKIKHNTKTMKDRITGNGMETMAAVTKVFCGNKEIAQGFVDGGADFLADSRIQNLEKLADFSVPKMLLRIPMLSEVDDVVKYADISLNSEIETLKALNEAAKGKKHKVILMVDLGDLREGFFQEEDFYEAVEAVLSMENLELHGVGVNLTCYGAVIPKPEILKRLDDYRQGVKDKFDYDLKIVSGGNSSSVYMLGKDELPGINNLRLGECLVLGTESSYGEDVEGLYTDAWTFQAQIIELKEKPSVPTADELGVDAFGNKPTFVDRGVRKRAIIAVGKQDVDNEKIVPKDSGIIVLGGSSDHTILDVTDASWECKVGDVIDFGVNYAAILSLCTSEYVEKEVYEG
ncbi:alanine/ornithine racemase family PLP-dependent enzyme [Peptoniphilus sp. KCTC 25270]|uniref:ornithine racemase Orr n=1 Tax=Peptoniphilus sp. KCTC 25270 TaxID=2897414 RepID=UPI001E50E3CD|nr:ornithine racemase Orr [Peptoniphilus sp. KCTC 25270]MCD1147183.1 alanine/ornithine racemase family PLP-dependent enzyme [Peptoniphilus sp. KCTC 25270]